MPSHAAVPGQPALHLALPDYIHTSSAAADGGPAVSACAGEDYKTGSYGGREHACSSLSGPQPPNPGSPGSISLSHRASPAHPLDLTDNLGLRPRRNLTLLFAGQCQEPTVRVTIDRGFGAGSSCL